MSDVQKEGIEKIRKSATGRKHTPETIEKLRNIHLGKKLSEEHKEKKDITLTILYSDLGGKKYGNVHMFEVSAYYAYGSFILNNGPEELELSIQEIELITK